MPLARRQGEQPDRALSPFVIAVEKFHHEECSSSDVLLEPAVIRIRGIPDRRLSEAHIARGHVEVAELRSERVGVRRFCHELG
jgi:hypothetical protein